MHSVFTGRLRAHLLDIFVAAPYREQGLARRLIVKAEDWARKQGFQCIGLSVADHNVEAKRLYKALGYETEALRMSKQLG